MDTHRREGEPKTETEIGVMWDDLGHQKMEEGMERILP